MTSLHPRLSADRFYWAVLTPSPDFPASSLRSLTAPMTRAVLDELFAAHLPVDLASVACSYTQLPDNTVLACAIPASVIDDPAHASAITLAPSGLPLWLEHEADPEHLNVLTGVYEPRPVTAARRRRSLVAASIAALVAVVLAVGFERRASLARADRAASQTAMDQLLRSKPAADLGLSPTNSVQTSSQALERELSRLRATRSTRAAIGLGDAADPLALLLATWPREIKAQVQTLTAAPTQVSMSALLPSLSDAERLAATLGTTPGWAPSQPQITTSGRGVQMQLNLSPISTPAPKPKGGTP